MYRRTALSSGLSPSEIFNGRQIRSLSLKSFPVHLVLWRQSKAANVSELSSSSSTTTKTLFDYNTGTHVYTACFAPKKNKDQRRVLAIVSKRLGTRHALVRVFPKGPVWKRHVEQLRPWYGADQDADPGETPVPADQKPVPPRPSV
ncbi:Pol polyprotein [Elysia marginata]|uniref:Pol polyprotein n=1 Tax=Elysia marginata TaxID=1093978 RepID=A0AAV4HB52_9GAST|nr:Pol polyprotein [Elysia marginata]